MYYVYEWYIIETGEIIYVGKGTRNRYKVRKHNSLFNEMIKRFECDSRIIRTFDNELDAFSYEYERIEELKKLNQCTCNIYHGGFGGSTTDWTNAKRKRYSENNVMKSEKQRERMSSDNPMKNKKTAEKVGLKHRKAVVIGDIEYPSVTEAAKRLNTGTGIIKLWCNKGINSKGELCRYKDSEQVEFNGKRYNKGGCRALTYKGKHYETPKDLYDELGVNQSVVLRWLKLGFDPYGNPCRYDDDDRELVFEMKRKSHHPVIVNGVRYRTMAAAARANNVSAQWIADLANHKYTDKNLNCEYDNQQPSRENFDNSITEGSETNG